MRLGNSIVEFKKEVVEKATNELVCSTSRSKPTKSSIRLKNDSSRTIDLQRLSNLLNLEIVTSIFGN